MANWYEIETRYDFQYKLYENESAGEVLAIEMQEEPWHADIENPDWSVYLLPPNAGENPEPEETIAHKLKKRGEAMERANKYMESM